MRPCGAGILRPVSERAWVEYKGQLVTGEVIRSFLFMRRVAIRHRAGYDFLAWVPKWKVRPR
jgi:hypothetical protein